MPFIFIHDIPADDLLFLVSIVLQEEASAINSQLLQPSSCLGWCFVNGDTVVLTSTLLSFGSLLIYNKLRNNNNKHDKPSRFSRLSCAKPKGEDTAGLSSHQHLTQDFCLLLPDGQRQKWSTRQTNLDAFICCCHLLP